GGDRAEEGDRGHRARHAEDGAEGLREGPSPDRPAPDEGLDHLEAVAAGGLAGDEEGQGQGGGVPRGLEAPEGLARDERRGVDPARAPAVTGMPGGGASGSSGQAERRRIASGSPFEPVIGFSRAVRDGRVVAVSGTAPVMPDGADPPPDAYGQAR